MITPWFQKFKSLYLKFSGWCSNSWFFALSITWHHDNFRTELNQDLNWNTVIRKSNKISPANDMDKITNRANHIPNTTWIVFQSHHLRFLSKVCVKVISYGSYESYQIAWEFTVKCKSSYLQLKTFLNVLHRSYSYTKIGLLAKSFSCSCLLFSMLSHSTDHW